MRNFGIVGVYSGVILPSLHVTENPNSDPDSEAPTSPSIFALVGFLDRLDIVLTARSYPLIISSPITGYAELNLLELDCTISVHKSALFHKERYLCVLSKKRSPKVLKD